MPRAWVVDKLLISSSKYFYNYLINNSYNTYNYAQFPYKNQKLPDNSKSGIAYVIKSDYHSMTLKAETAGLLVISDTWYPRWKAKVNGKQSRVFRVNHSMRGVFVDQPGSLIEMYYDYDDIIILSIISYFAILLSIVVFYKYYSS